MEREAKIVLIAISAMVLIAIGATAWLFLFNKKFDFVVEASCDPQTQTCFVRDCSIEDECPPNGFDNYSMYGIDAIDFERCTDLSCADVCAEEGICTPIECDPEAGDECSVLEEETMQVEAEPMPIEDTTEENTELVPS